MTLFRNRRRLLLGIGAYVSVSLCYCGFFALPVSPAEPSDPLSFVVEDRLYSLFPSIHETIYTNGKAFIAIATIRTVSAPSSAYSIVFDRLDEYAESHVREQYGVEVDIEVESTTSDYEFSGHNAVKYTYAVFKDVSVFHMTEYVKVAEIGALAWFCNVDFESVVLFYVTPTYFIDDMSLLALSLLTFDVVDDVSCH